MTQNRGTDLRPPIIVIDESVVDDYDLTPMAGWLYVVIVRHINRKKNDAFPSISRLAKKAHMSRASVMRYTKELEDTGLIRVDREKEDSGENLVNHYKLLPVNRVVSDSNYPSASQQLPVVSHSNTNHTELNQKKLTREKDKEILPVLDTPANPNAKISPEQKAQAKAIFEGIVEKFDGNDKQHAFTDEELQAQIAVIQAKYGNRESSVKKAEATS